jgi:hypothetical protein
MARPTHVYTIDYVATLIGENLELIQKVASNSDNIDYGEMIHAHDGSEEGITTFTERGIESLKEFLADIRTCPSANDLRQIGVAKIGVSGPSLGLI